MIKRRIVEGEKSKAQNASLGKRREWLEEERETLKIALKKDMSKFTPDQRNRVVKNLVRRIQEIDKELEKI